MKLAELLHDHLPPARLQALLADFPRLTIGVVGDFFLDAYYDCDPALDEPSLETGRNCYQVVRTRRQAGAAGTVAANLRALGVGQVHAVGFCGDDGEGYELRRAMAGLGLNLDGFITCPERFTPTYAKPTYVRGRGRREASFEELERIDIKNRRRTPKGVQDAICGYLEAHALRWHGMIVVDQVTEASCGVITRRVRQLITRTLAVRPGAVVLADSRARLALFRNVILKPNQNEAASLDAAPDPAAETSAPTCEQADSLPARKDPGALARMLTRRSHRPVFITLGSQGLLAAHADLLCRIPAVQVPPPVDPVGAGDSTSAALMAALAAGADPVQGALLSVLAASITVQQLGTTGTASPARIRRRHREVLHGF